LETSILEKMRGLMGDGGAIRISSSLMVVAPVVALSTASDDTNTMRWDVITLALLATGIVLVHLRRPALGQSSIRVLGWMGALTFWSCASYVWSADPSATVVEMQRWLMLAVATAVFAMAARIWGSELLGAWVALAATVVCSYALATRLLPGWLGARGVGINRLSAPLGYWNALGALAVIGIILCAGFAATGSSRARSWCTVATVPLATVLYFTFSRGALLGAIVGFVTLIALERERIVWVVKALVVVPPAILAVAAMNAFPALTSAFPSRSAEVIQGWQAATVLVVIVIVGGCAAQRWPRLTARMLASNGSRKRSVRALWASLILAGCLVVASSGGPMPLIRALGTVGQSSPHFKHGDLNLRLLSLSDNGRSEIWRVAWQDALSHPIIGSGDGSFAKRWLALRTEPLPATAAHSLYLETLSELGMVGLTLLVALFLVPFSAARRARGTPLTAPLTGAVAAFLAQAAFDWIWDVSALTLAALACVAALTSADRAIGSAEKSSALSRVLR
jgi:hypothetical protein